MSMQNENAPASLASISEVHELTELSLAARRRPPFPPEANSELGGVQKWRIQPSRSTPSSSSTSRSNPEAINLDGAALDSCGHERSIEGFPQAEGSQAIANLRAALIGHHEKTSNNGVLTNEVKAA